MSWKENFCKRAASLLGTPKYNVDLQVLSFKTFEVTIHWLSKVCLFSETLRITGSKCPKLCLSLTSKAAEEKNVRALGSVQSID